MGRDRLDELKPEPRSYSRADDEFRRGAAGGHHTIEMDRLGGSRRAGADAGRRVQGQQPRAPAAAHASGRRPSTAGHGRPSGRGSRVDYHELKRKMDSIKRDIADAHAQIDQVDVAYRNALNASSTQQASIMASLRDKEVHKAKVMFGDIKAEMAALNRMKEGYQSSSISDEQKNIVASMYKSLASNATGLLGRYKETVKGYAGEFRNRLKAQYRIVNPHATDDEVRAAIEDDEADNAFMLGIRRSNKNGQMTQVLDRVKERRDEVKKIEKAVMELAEMFAEMSKMVNEQQEVLDSIEDAVEVSYTHVESGNREIKQSVVIAKKTRKLRWWFIGVFIVALIVIGVALYLKLKK